MCHICGWQKDPKIWYLKQNFVEKEEFSLSPLQEFYTPPLEEIASLNPSGRFGVASFYFQSFVIGAGSFVEIVPKTNRTCLFIIITSLQTTGGKLFLSGFLLAPVEGDTVVYLKTGEVKDIEAYQILNLFSLLPVSERGSRMFWPSFVRFMISFDELLSISPCLESTHNAQQQLSMLSGRLISSISSLLKTKAVGAKLLFSFCPLDFLGDLVHFLKLDPNRKETLVVDGDFKMLHELVGDSYYFLSQRLGEYAKCGWGFGECSDCFHYVFYLKFVLNPKKSELKVFGAQLLQNSYGKFQVVSWIKFLLRYVY
jgi:hypothetical protein